jgi:hypothetical protein
MIIQFYAVDPGAKETLQAFCFCVQKYAKLKMHFHWFNDSQFEIRQENMDCAVVGTSTSLHGFQSEERFRTKVRSADIPLIAIEDMDGNYAHAKTNAANADVIIVRDRLNNPFSKHHNTNDPIEVWSGALVRYTGVEFANSPLFTKQGQKSECLWIGQPHNGDDLNWLEYIFNIIINSNYRLLFRAHPRDKAYINGKLSSIFNMFNDNLIDVSHLSIKELIFKKPLISVSESSSLSVQMYFYGTIPVFLRKSVDNLNLLSNTENFYNSFGHICTPTNFGHVLTKVVHNENVQAIKWNNFKSVFNWNSNSEIELVRKFEAFLMKK